MDEILENTPEDQTHDPGSTNPRASVTAAFDSVGLINGIIAGTQLTEESVENKIETIERNIGHLDIMCCKEWFCECCENNELPDIEATIAAGKKYITDNQI